MTLYDLTGEYMELLAMMEDPDVDPDVLQDTMEAIGGEIEYKAEGYVCVAKELEAEADKFDKEIERLIKNRDSLRNNAKRVKTTLLTAMELIDMPKITTEHFKVSIAKNGGLQPMKITGEVPKEYMLYKPEPDSKKIREALNNGLALDFAHLEERGRHLNIK